MSFLIFFYLIQSIFTSLGYDGIYCQNFTCIYGQKSSSSLDSPCTCNKSYITGTRCDRVDSDSCNSYCNNNNTKSCQLSIDETIDCVCKNGFYGKQCDDDSPINDSSNPNNNFTNTPSQNYCRCRNNGQCQTDSSGKILKPQKCICENGFAGQYCEKMIACQLSPCVNNGVCNSVPYSSNTPSGYKCKCKKGYSGVNCEKDVCQPSPCKNKGTCQHNRDLTSSQEFVCMCKNNFHGIFCEKNPCQHGDDNNPAPITCQNNGTCKMSADKINWYCNCGTGFTGKMCQSDIDECSESAPCNYFQKCVNLHGSYRCDVGCDMNAGNNPCQNGGICEQAHSGNYSCKCGLNFEGKNCETKKNFCKNIKCQNGSICVDHPDSYECQCVNNFYGGNKCEKYCENKCQNGGICSKGECQCHNDFMGEYCGIRKQKNVGTKNTACESKPCKNNGVCNITGMNSYSCRCQTGFRGPTYDLCKTTIDPCSLTTSRGHCAVKNKQTYCKCDLGWTGSKCQERINPCHRENKCKNDSTCSVSGYSIKDVYCKCHNGYYGSTCMDSYVSCGNKICYNNGKCNSKEGKCNCKNTGYTGEFCERKVKEVRIKPEPGYELCDPQLECHKTSGDGHCDAHCNTANCNFDGFDCLKVPIFEIIPSALNRKCNLVYNDGKCDQECNNTMAGFDGSDCNKPKFSDDKVELRITMPLEELNEKKNELARSLTAAAHTLVKIVEIIPSDTKERVKRDTLSGGSRYSTVHGLVLGMKVNTQCINKFEPCYKNAGQVGNLFRSHQKESDLNINGFVIETIKLIPDEPINNIVKICMFIVCLTLVVLLSFTVIIKVKQKKTWLTKQLPSIGFSTLSRRKRDRQSDNQSVGGYEPKNKIINNRQESTGLLAPGPSKIDPTVMDIDDEVIELLNPLHEEISSENCSLEKKNDSGETALHLAARYNRSRSIIKVLLDEGHARPDLYDNSGLTCLHQAIFSEAYDCYEALIFISKFGSKLLLQSTDAENQSVLMMIIRSGINSEQFIQVIQNFTAARVAYLQQQILENEKLANMHAAVGNGVGQSLLGSQQQQQHAQQHASMTNPTELWDDLIAMKDKNGRNAIHWCAAVNNPQALRKIFDVDRQFYNQNTNINIDEIDDSQETALFIAASEGHKEIVHLLLQCNCNMDQPDHLEQTPTEIASKKNHLEIVDIINNHRLERARNPIVEIPRMQALTQKEIQKQNKNNRKKATAKRKSNKNKDKSTPEMPKNRKIQTKQENSRHEGTQIYQAPLLTTMPSQEQLQTKIEPLPHMDTIPTDQTLSQDAASINALSSIGNDASQPVHVSTANLNQPTTNTNSPLGHNVSPGQFIGMDLPYIGQHFKGILWAYYIEIEIGLEDSDYF